MVKPVKLVASWLVLAAAVAITGYAWYRTQAVVPPGGVRWITWADANGAPLPEAPHTWGECYGSQDGELDELILGEQLIVPCWNGYAFIDVARGTGTLLDVPDAIGRVHTRAMLPGPGDQLALLWDSDRASGGGTRVTLVAVADRARIRWRIPPAKIALGSLLATAWVDGAYEIAHYEYVDRGDGSGFGDFQTFIERVTDGGVTRRTLASCKLCTPIAAIHGGRRGWGLVVSAPVPPSYESTVKRLLSEHGPAVDLEDGPRTPDISKMGRTDGLAQGLLETHGTEAALVLGPDGYLQERPLTAPGPGLRPQAWQRIRVVGGALERQRVWVEDEAPGHHAQVIGGRTLFTRTDGHDDVLVGDDRSRMRLASRMCELLVLGTWMEVGGALALVSSDGNCLALFDPRTLEPQIRPSLREHLRTEGSRRREIRTPEAEPKLAVVLFGLLPCLVVAAVVVAVRRRGGLVPALAIGAAVYAVVALILLRDVLPLLS
jgi:hypothetical protein